MTWNVWVAEDSVGGKFSESKEVTRSLCHNPGGVFFLVLLAFKQGFRFFVFLGFLFFGFLAFICGFQKSVPTTMVPSSMGTFLPVGVFGFREGRFLFANASAWDGVWQHW